MNAYRIKNVAEINKSTIPDDTDPDFTFKYIDIGSVGSDGKITMPNDTIKFSSSPSRARRIAPEGSVIVSTVRTYLQAITTVPPSEEPLVFSTGFATLEATSRVDKRFLGYHCRSQNFLDKVTARSTGVSYPAINPSDIGDLPITLPPLEEQRRIADFLDAETSRMDKLANLRMKQLALLWEHLDSSAKEATGRTALRINASHTTTKLARALTMIRTGTTPHLLKDFSGNTSPNTIPWYTPAALDGTLRVRSAEKEVDNDASVPLFPAGSILITGIGESLGKVGYLTHRATGNQQLTALYPSSTSNGRFIAWQLWAAQDELRNWAQYSRVRIINNETLGNFPIFLPLQSIQDSVVAHLDEELEEVISLKEVTDKFVLTIRERQRALITAAVTGQFDVSTASGRGVTE